MPAANVTNIKLVASVYECTSLMHLPLLKLLISSFDVFKIAWYLITTVSVCCLGLMWVEPLLYTGAINGGIIKHLSQTPPIGHVLE